MQFKRNANAELLKLGKTLVETVPAYLLCYYVDVTSSNRLDDTQLRPVAFLLNLLHAGNILAPGAFLHVRAHVRSA